MFYIKKIELEKIRGFKKLEIDVSTKSHEPRMKTIVIGKNGTLKSTLLRCIAIGLCDPEDANSLVAEPIGRFITEGCTAATITIELQDIENLNEKQRLLTTIRAKGEKEVVAIENDRVSIPSDSLFASGYGAGRSTESPDRFREYRIIDSVYGLFEYEQGLIDTELTLRRLRDFLGTAIYENTMERIKRALGLADNDKIELPKGGGVVISGPSIGKRIPLVGWADGYRLTFNWLMDLFAWAMKAKRITSSGDIRGVLLIDEVEQHLHPSMQTNMLRQLSYLFPKLQIFATTHSPLVALGAKQEELVVLKRKIKYVDSEKYVPHFTGYSAEDMLVDEKIFATRVYSPEINKKLARYHQLSAVSREKRTFKQTKELRSLAKDLRVQNIPEIRESDLAKELKKFRKKYDL